jgi:hypothetical protein
VKQEMDDAAKAAQAEARSKRQTAATKPAAKPEAAKTAEAPKPGPQASPEPARAASLFDAPAPATVPTRDTDEEEQILAEAAEEDQAGDEDQLDDAA